MQSNPLDALHDVIVPDKAPWWPLAPAWWVIIVLLLSTLLAAVYFWLRQHRHNAAKREAVRLSNALPGDELVERHLLLKRLARHYYGNAPSARSGKAWCDTLQSLSGLSFTPEELEILYRPAPRDEMLANRLASAIRAFKTKGVSDV